MWAEEWAGEGQEGRQARAATNREERYEKREGEGEGRGKRYGMGETKKEMGKEKWGEVREREIWKENEAVMNREERYKVVGTDTGWKRQRNEGLGNGLVTWFSLLVIMRIEPGFWTKPSSWDMPF
jgi:hypothetical protein